MDYVEIVASTLRIQICPIGKGSYIRSYSGDGIWTINPTLGRGVWIRRAMPVFTSRDVCIYNIYSNSIVAGFLLDHIHYRGYFNMRLLSS